MARKQYTYHYIYKTTCKVTKRFYIGMHSTSNLEDGYIGSGKRLWNSIRKHGKENHSIEILEWFLDRSSLKERERELVNEDMLKDSMCMNLKLGGEGGWSNLESKEISRISSLGGLKSPKWKNHSNKLKNDDEYRTVYSKKIGESKLREKNPFYGKTHSIETITQMKKSHIDKHIGSNNSQFGTVWVVKNGLVKKIKNDNLSSMLEDGWKRGRK